MQQCNAIAIASLSRRPWWRARITWGESDKGAQTTTGAEGEGYASACTFPSPIVPSTLSKPSFRPLSLLQDHQSVQYQSSTARQCCSWYSLSTTFRQEAVSSREEGAVAVDQGPCPQPQRPTFTHSVRFPWTRTTSPTTTEIHTLTPPPRPWQTATLLQMGCRDESQCHSRRQHNRFRRTGPRTSRRSSAAHYRRSA